MLRLRIVGHPEKQMLRRGITRADIESALQRHHTMFATGDSVRYIGPACNDQDLKVVTMPPGFVDADTVTVIKTVAWNGVDDPE